MVVKHNTSNNNNMDSKNNNINNMDNKLMTNNVVVVEWIIDWLGKTIINMSVWLMLILNEL